MLLNLGFRGYLNRLLGKLKGYPFGHPRYVNSFASPWRDRPGRSHELDLVLCGVLALLLAFGVIMVHSASIALPDHPRFAANGILPSYFLVRHVIAIAVGIACAWGMLHISMDTWERHSTLLFVLALSLLLVVLIPKIGVKYNGARRWLSVFGGISFQPSECVKFAVVLYAASYMERKSRDMDVGDRKSFLKTVWPMVIVTSVTGILLLLEPDMGAFLLVALIATSILFFGGINARLSLLLVLVLILVFCAVIFFSEWRRERIFSFFQPLNPKYIENRGYQLLHALIALSRGEISGVGLGKGVEKMSWLPEAHTDFLMAIIGEELGVLGVLVLIVTFFWLTCRMMRIGQQAALLNRIFAALVAKGVAFWLGLQAFIHIGVNLGALPTKGLVLPFMSYGGSALILNLLAAALVLRVDYENKRLRLMRRRNQ